MCSLIQSTASEDPPNCTSAAAGIGDLRNDDRVVTVCDLFRRRPGSIDQPLGLKGVERVLNPINRNGQLVVVLAALSGRSLFHIRSRVLLPVRVFLITGEPAYDTASECSGRPSNECSYGCTCAHSSDRVFALFFVRHTHMIQDGRH